MNLIGPPSSDLTSGFEWTGEWTVTFETFRDMGIAFMAALVLIYGLIVVEFRDYALAGLWLEVLSYADMRQEDQARALFPVLIEKDADISSPDKAEELMRKALQRLMEIRGEHGLPKVCS